MKAGLTLLFAIIVFHTQAQTGIYAWTAFDNAQRDSYLAKFKENGYKGIRIIIPWYVVQPTRSLNFTALKAVIAKVSAAELNMELHIWTADNSPIFGETNWLTEMGVETFTTTGGPNDGPWPNYYNPIYIEAFDALHAGLAEMLNNLPDDQKKWVKSAFVSCGVTGDLGPYKGTPVSTSYGIANDETWKEYYRERWTRAYNNYQKNNSFMHMTLNAGNAAENLQWIVENMPDNYIKHADRSHKYPLMGETYMLNWPKRLYLGEVDDMIKDGRLPDSHFQLIRSALSVHTGRLDFYDEWLELEHVPVMVEFFNKYVTQFDPVTANRGFCALAEKLNYKDTIQFPKVIFGELYDYAQGYYGDVKRINSMDIDSFAKQMKLVNNDRDHLRPTRLINLMKTGAGYAPEGPYYINDIVWYALQNYSLNVKQLLINQTSKGIRTFGADPDPETSIYGRNAREPIEFDGKKALYFRIDDNLITTRLRDIVTITVTYKDEGFATWKINCSNRQKKINNTNSGTWKKAEFRVIGFIKGGQLRYGSDFFINLVDGQAFPVDMVEVYNESKSCEDCGAFVKADHNGSAQKIQLAKGK